MTNDKKAGELNGKKICPRCQADMTCTPENIAQCTCSTVDLTPETRVFLQKTTFDCLCNACLADIDKKINALVGQRFPKSGELIENQHYYMEGAYFVFTETYHILRGYCCRSGCRHCPYGFKKLIV